MQIVEYKYIKPTIQKDGYIAIEGLDRERYATEQFIELAELDIQLDKPTAVLYVDGFTVNQSETRVDKKDRFNIPIEIGPSPITVKSGSSYSMHQWIKEMNGNENVVYASVVADTCASSMHALYQAERLLYEGVCEEVVIIGEERTSRDTLRLFKELMIDVTCGDGFVYIRLDNSSKSKCGVYDTKWLYEYNNNPFIVSKEAVLKLKPMYSVDFVKVHGTGTKANDEAESLISEIGKIVQYKNTTGHTQGVSGLLEMCMAIDDTTIYGKVLCIATGFGGFIGGCTLIKS